MMPGLGKYTDTVLWSYAATILLLVLLVVQSLMRGRRVRARLEEAEKRARKDG